MKLKKELSSKATCNECLKRISKPYYLEGRAYCSGCFNYLISHPEVYFKIPLKGTETPQDKGLDDYKGVDI